MTQALPLPAPKQIRPRDFPRAAHFLSVAEA